MTMGEQVLDANNTDKPKEDKSKVAFITKWTERIKAAKEYWKDDFDRMHGNMSFAKGFQWMDQGELNCDKYVANLTLKTLQQRVSSLYAKNPKVKAARRPRLDFKMWDGRIEAIQQAAAVQMAAATEAVPEDQLLTAQALLQDYTRGRQQQDLIDRIGRTMETVFTWQMEDCQPSFKKLMKGVVKNVVVTGAAFAKLGFTRQESVRPDPTTTESPIQQRTAKAVRLATRLMEEKADEESVETTELEQTMVGFEESHDEWNIEERLTFDFPSTTSILVDPRCRSLNGFVGARWIAQEYSLSKNDIEEFYGVSLDGDTSAKRYTTNQFDGKLVEDAKCDDEKTAYLVWEVYDKTTRTMFTILEGYEFFLDEVQPIFPKVKRIWPFIALTFNDLVDEPGKSKGTIYPPSEVDLMKSAQKEWNRTRDELKHHRIASAPRYGCKAGSLTDKDRESLALGKPHQVFELQNIGTNDDVAKIIQPIPVAPVDFNLYNTDPIREDLMGTTGNENGTTPSSPDSTATTASINEQNRNQVDQCHVDDLDEFLSEIAEAGGEILMLEMSQETAERIAGLGAVWPSDETLAANLAPDLANVIPLSRQDFVNYVYLKVEAGSSGRPNRAMEISNFVQLAPLLQAAGANPHVILREGLRRLDDNLEPEQAFPVGMSSSALLQPPGQAPSQSPTGRRAPSPSGQMPAETEPQRERVERPQVK